MKKNKEVAQGIGLLFDLAATMGKTAVTKVLDPETTEESLEETRKTMKKNFKQQLKNIVSRFFDDDEDEEEKKSDDAAPETQGDK